jgi:hypothetical protein
VGVVYCHFLKGVCTDGIEPFPPAYPATPQSYNGGLEGDIMESKEHSHLTGFTWMCNREVKDGIIEEWFTRKEYS